MSELSGPSPFASLNGAVAEPELGPIAHFGAPNQEQRALANGVAITDLSDRGIISVTGPDRLTWLDSITSQRISSLRPGESSETILLGPTGRIEHNMHVFDDGETTWLIVEQSQVHDLFAFLDRMRFTLRVEVAIRSEEFIVVGAFLSTAEGEPSPAAGILSEHAAVPAGIPLVWADSWATPPAGGWQYAAEADATGEPHPAPLWRAGEAVIPRSSVGQLLLSLPDAGVSVAGWLAFEALRVEAWRPRQLTEVDERSIPHEYDWMRTAVHLNKGCYRGQETVAKVHNLGHPPRRLVMLHLDGTESILPGHGDPVYVGEGEDRKQVGLITSAARHYELGGIALALLKRSAPADVDLVVVVGDDQTEIAAGQNVIVPPGAGAVADVPKLPRLGVRRPG
ncbi:CAF17-like 4Fe-4S cluster assembly/insertion protein YgfZ [Lysinibacter cavernae]|uniref:Folate-binding protein n=1 Tax=Lysinibacter cavernae TaxID=1640652 RepID=A0A7X5TTW6_9MICO|nr:folate-binding protein YgfZ [Lysinibacter cavernae]NIH55056.1 hypothetical protein [Lysinibacter cavernae]